MRKNYCTTWEPDLMAKTEEASKRYGFKNVSHYLNYCASLVNAQDSQSWQMLNHFADVRPGTYLQILLLDQVAKGLAEVEVCGSPQDQMFYLRPDGSLLTGEQYFRTRYAKHLKAYKTALDFKTRIDKAASDVAVEQALSEVQNKIERVPE